MERGPARQHLVQDHPQGINVRSGANGFALDHVLFGGHVGGRAHDGTALRLAGILVELLGQAEIGDLEGAVGTQ